MNAPVVTSLEQLRRPSAPEASMPAVRMSFDSLQGFELMQRVAKAFAASTLVPTDYVGNMPNVLVALEMASRMGASPLMVMQNLYIVHGRPGWSSQFLIASFNQCGRFSAVRYQWAGEKDKDTWGCKAWAVELSTKDRIEGPTVTIRQAKVEGWYDKKGSKWQTLPELMLMYRAAGFMVRTHAPEIAMGLQTAEELHDVFDVEPGSYTVTTEQLRSGPQAAGETSTPEPQAEPEPVPAEPPRARATRAKAAPEPVERPSAIAQFRSAMERADATADQETAWLLIDEARSISEAIDDDQREAAHVALSEAIDSIKAKFAG